VITEDDNAATVETEGGRSRIVIHTSDTSYFVVGFSSILSISQDQKDALGWLSDNSYRRGEWMVNKSHSGADKSESEIYIEESRLYQSILRGNNPEVSILESVKHFERYVDEVLQKIEDSPKISHGPRSGQSWLDHRWVEVEMFTRRLDEIRRKISIALNEPEKVIERRGNI